MGRRRSGLDEVVELAALLPWWLSLLIAVVLWFVLGAYADSEAVAVGANPTAALASSIPRMFASIGRYVLPAAFVLGALTSGGRAIRNGHLLRRVARHGPSRLLSSASQVLKPDPLLTISWQDFEHLVGEIYRRRGYSVSETARGADGGVDVVLRRDSECLLVQCKHWRARNVGVSVVRELYGVVVSRGAAGGVVVTAGHFTAEAVEFARETGIELVDGEQLRQQAWLADRVGTLPLTPSSQAALESDSLFCPRCGSPMVERVARRGSQSGRPFWGCSRFPKCRGMRST